MSNYKIEVKDRVSTYPGRVVLTPVSGQTNTYDMARADQPTEDGTRIDKKLFDQKAYTLTSNITVYVSTTGSDVTGDGTSVAPYQTISKAVSEIPKCLGGFHAQIDVADGTYNERVNVDGFYGGRLTIGASGRTIVVRGISVQSSSVVRLYVSNITYSSTYAGSMLYVDNNSTVVVLSPMTINCGNAAVNGVGATRSSKITCEATVAVLNTTSAGVLATYGSKIHFNAINGNGNTSYGLRADMGGLITYASRGTIGNSDSTANGGRILTSSGTNLANASIE